MLLKEVNEKLKIILKYVCILKYCLRVSLLSYFIETLNIYLKICAEFGYLYLAVFLRGFEVTSVPFKAFSF